MRFSSFVRSRAVRVLISVTVGASVLVTLPAVAAAAPAAAPAAVVTAPPGIRTAITPGLKGFDTQGGVSASSIACLSNQGYSFAMVNTNDLSYQAYNNAAAAGLKVVLFQGYFAAYWTSVGYGASQGVKAAGTAKTLGYPAGATIFLNLEGTTDNRAILQPWVQNWAAAVRAAGYLAGVYVGIDAGLTAADLNAMPGVSVYWKSASTSGVPVVSRGYVLQQPISLFEKPLCGTTIDGNIAGTDSNRAQLIGAAFPAARTAPTAAGTFVPLSPSRLLDTRHGVGAATGAVRPNGRVNLRVTGSIVPSTASAVVLNVTATDSTKAGNIAVTPTGQPIRVSNVNFVPGRTVPNLVTVQVGTSGQVTLVNGSTGSVQMIADVAGYYLGGTPSAAGTFTAVTPTRLLDTRPHPVGSGTTTAVQITGRVTGTGTAAVTLPPAGTVSSAVLNLTAVGPKTAGYLKAFSGVGSAPNASTLNFVAGQTVPGLALVPVSASTGRIALINGSKGTTDLLADVAGYYTAGTPTLTGAFVPTTPTRILDTRANVGSIGAVPAGSATALQVSGAGRAVPPNATAVAINVTVTGPSGLGYLSVFPSDRSAPLASNLNFVRGQTVANLVLVPIGTDGKIVLNNQSNGTADLIGDVAGYFIG